MLGPLEIIYTTPRACLIGGNPAEFSSLKLKHLHEFKWNFWAQWQSWENRTIHGTLGTSIHAVKCY